VMLAYETRLAELLNVFKWRQASHELLCGHLPKRGEACVTEVRVLAPGFLSCLGRQTH
jgi:hypothetical protein